MNMLYKIIFATIFFFLFTSLWGFYNSVRPPKIISNISPGDLKLNYKNVSFTTQDKIKLAGWRIFSPTKEAKTIILLHGYPADKGDILRSLSFLNKEYDLLLFDFRYLGKSEGKYSAIGGKETEDLLAAIRFLKSRGVDEVGVWGLSMGGAVALMTAAEAPEIKAVVSESSYAQLDLMAKELYRPSFIKYPLAKLTELWAKIFLGISLKNTSPQNSASQLKIPVLIIHSETDEVIPFEHALLLKEALKNNSQAEFWFPKDLFHGQLGGKYQKRVEEFFGKNL